MGSTPVRTCIGCRVTAPVDRLVRIALQPDGVLATGPGVPGRGAWLCRGSPCCFDLAVKRRSFDRALRARVDPGAIERLGRSEVVAAGEGGP